MLRAPNKMKLKELKIDENISKPKLDFVHLGSITERRDTALDKRAGNFQEAGCIR